MSLTYFIVRSYHSVGTSFAIYDTTFRIKEEAMATACMHSHDVPCVEVLSLVAGEDFEPTQVAVFGTVPA
ncbi:hypothetical protein ASG43_01835 [Aureimonas sp. Leaf454]|nr:hypothetical protein ASG43_01835 [Aureimonas sp. Leaf454]